MSNKGSFKAALEHEMRMMVEDFSTWGMSAEEAAAWRRERDAIELFWKEHRDALQACRGLADFVFAQYAEFLLRACLWATNHPEVVGELKLTVLYESNLDEYTLVFMNLSDTQVDALRYYAWRKYTDDDDFSAWLIKMRLADPAPRTAMRVVILR